jgi:UDP-N-acetyl-D-glucosamine dehydrogenase
MRKHDIGLASVPCSAEEFAKYDALLVSTAHTAFRDPALFANARLVIDTRNIVQREDVPVVRA